LPNYGKKVATTGNATWPNIREAQRRALRVSGTSLVSLIDLGEEDVHPPNKKPAGERAALSALAHVYGKSTPSTGPMFDSVAIESGKAVLSFRPNGAGLIAQPLPATYRPTYSASQEVPLIRNSPGSELEGFAICGADHQWKWAQAKIDGDKVVVWSPAVTEPVAVRYAWADNPTGNLYNTAGLPASPFQTDELK
jgi:sialate O-acetylesterase